MVVSALSLRNTAAPSVGGVSLNTVTVTSEAHCLNEPASIEETEDGIVTETSLVPQNTLFLIVVRLVGKVISERFELVNALISRVVTDVKFTNSLNVEISVFPLNVVPMEYHRDDIQK